MSPRIMCHHHDLSNIDRELIESKVERLKKFFNRIHETSVILDAAKHTMMAEILLWGPQLSLRVQGEGEDMRSAFEEAVNKAERWLRKTKEKKWGDKMHRRRNVTIRRFGADALLLAEIPEETVPEPEIPVERMEPMPLSVAEARQAMEEKAGMVIFINDETNELNILHRNQDGQIELVEVAEVEIASIKDEQATG